MKKQWMTAFGLIGMIAAIIWACHKEQPVTITPAEQQLSLVSPEGYALAGSVAELKTQLAEGLAKRMKKNIAPNEITIRDIRYLGDARVRAASILLTSPEGRHSVLRILYVKPGMTFVKRGNALGIRKRTDADIMSAPPPFPGDVDCRGVSCCHWIWDPDGRCVGPHYQDQGGWFVCDCTCQEPGAPFFNGCSF